MGDDDWPDTDYDEQRRDNDFEEWPSTDDEFEKSWILNSTVEQPLSAPAMLPQVGTASPMQHVFPQAGPASPSQHVIYCIPCVEPERPAYLPEAQEITWAKVRPTLPPNSVGVACSGEP